MNDSKLKTSLISGSAEFWRELAICTREAIDFSELFRPSSLRKKAYARQPPREGMVREKLRLAILGGYSLYPLHECFPLCGQTNDQFLVRYIVPIFKKERPYLKGDHF